MRLFGNFEVPNIFGMLSKWNVPLAAPEDHRPVSAVLAQPQFRFYNPDSLNFPDMQGPVVRGNQNVTLGVGPVAYDNQALWDRNDVADAGPVRQFFADQQKDNRVKRAG